MHKAYTTISLGLFLLVFWSTTMVFAGADQNPLIQGTYVEARTSDVYTGPCFANGEVNVAGKEAILAWRVERGGWGGADLSGLSVVAVLKARATLGDPFSEPHPRSVVLVDERAEAEQRSALLAFARTMAEGLLEQIVSVEVARVQIVSTGAGEALIVAGDQVRVRTRGLNQQDHLCGNEEIYYPPLGSPDEVVPGVTLEHEYSGSVLGTRWKSPGKRSAFVGTFARY